jgi:hypothetical protein
LAGRSKEGAQMFAISIFAAAVNKSTLETFLADTRFAEIRPLLSAALSIQGRSNMTALTLLGHCLLTTDLASRVNFSSEFRKKMGQNSLWDGDLDKGSLSDKQREILKEKKRVTDVGEAKALGGGFIKLTGLSPDAMTELERDMFKQSKTAPVQAPSQSAVGASGSRFAASAVSPPSSRPLRPVTSAPSSALTIDMLPADVLEYRRNVMRYPDSEILNSLERRGLDDFIAITRSAMTRDPTGELTRSGSTVG